MLDYKQVKDISELNSLFRRKKEIKRIKDVYMKNNTVLFLVTMLDNSTKDFQGAAVIGVENGMWGILAMRSIKGYRNTFMDIIEENVPWFLSEYDF